MATESRDDGDVLDGEVRRLRFCFGPAPRTTVEPHRDERCLRLLHDLDRLTQFIQWHAVTDQLRPKMPKLAAFMDEAEVDVFVDMGFPAQHRAKLHSTNPLERLNGDIERRTEVVGIFPDEDAIVRLVGAILFEQNDEWAVRRSRDMTLETIAAIGDDPAAPGLRNLAARVRRL